MATPKRQEVTCPACTHTQREYVEANSTFCHACGFRFPLQAAKPRKARKAAQTSLKLNRRRIHCMHCSHPIQIPEASDSWQCPVCSEYLDLKNHILTGVAGRSLLTYGDISIESKGSFAGNRAEGKNVSIAGGSVSGQITARERLEITRTSRVNADLKCESFHLTAGASMESRKALRCQDAVIEGNARFREVHVTGLLIVKAGAKLRTEELHAQSIQVEKGGSLIATRATSPAKEDNSQSSQASSPAQDVVAPASPS
jgi:cytoskeletal protein CcmA (bactofilin family)